MISKLPCRKTLKMSTAVELVNVKWVLKVHLFMSTKLPSLAGGGKSPWFPSIIGSELVAAELAANCSSFCSSLLSLDWSWGRTCWCWSGRGRVGSLGFVLHWKNFTCAVKDSQSVLPTQKSEDEGAWLVGISLSSIIHTMRPLNVNVTATQRRNPLRDYFLR